MSKIKPLYFYWISSFSIALFGYYFLWIFMPGHKVFGSLFRMLPYHHRHPVHYILITCLIFGVFAILFQSKFLKGNWLSKLLFTLLIVFLTISVSSIFGGMLWHFHDMQAGFFPDRWVSKLVSSGINRGLLNGWPIIIDSFPYNILGFITSFFLLKTGTQLSN